MICDYCKKKSVFLKKITYVAQILFKKKYIFSLDMLKDHFNCHIMLFNKIIYDNFPMPSSSSFLQSKNESEKESKKESEKDERVDIYFLNESLNRCLTCNFYGQGLSNVSVEFPTEERYVAKIAYVTGHEGCLKKKIKEVQTELLGM